MNKNTNISLENPSFWCCGFALTLALAAGVLLEEALTWSFFWNGKIKQRNEDLKYDSMKARGTDWKTARSWNTEEERRMKKPSKQQKNVLWEIPAQREIKIPFNLAKTPAKDYTEIKHKLKTRLSFYCQIALLKDSNFNFLF